MKKKITAAAVGNINYASDSNDGGDGTFRGPAEAWFSLTGPAATFANFADDDKAAWKTAVKANPCFLKAGYGRSAVNNGRWFQDVVVGGKPEFNSNEGDADTPGRGYLMTTEGPMIQGSGMMPSVTTKFLADLFDEDNRDADVPAFNMFSDISFNPPKRSDRAFQTGAKSLMSPDPGAKAYGAHGTLPKRRSVVVAAWAKRDITVTPEADGTAAVIPTNTVILSDGSLDIPGEMNDDTELVLSGEGGFDGFNDDDPHFLSIETPVSDVEQRYIYERMVYDVAILGQAAASLGKEDKFFSMLPGDCFALGANEQGHKVSAVIFALSVVLLATLTLPRFLWLKWVEDRGYTLWCGNAANGETYGNIQSILIFLLSLIVGISGITTSVLFMPVAPGESFTTNSWADVLNPQLFQPTDEGMFGDQQSTIAAFLRDIGNGNANAAYGITEDTSKAAWVLCVFSALIALFGVVKIIDTLNMKCCCGTVSGGKMAGDWS